jgi:integrase/recombinase XerD
MRKDKQRGLGLSWYVEWKQTTRIRARLEGSLFAPYWDDLARALFGRGYTWYTVRRTFEIAEPFGVWVAASGVRCVGDLTEELIAEYRRGLRVREGPRALRALMESLRELGVVPHPAATSVPAAGHIVLEEYLQFLRRHRGLSAARCAEHGRHIQALLDALGAGSTAEALEASTITRFITARTAELAPSQRKVLCAAVRSFLRFLHLHGWLVRDLVSAVPVIPTFKLDRVPKAMAWQDIEKILAVIDRSTPQGKRDYALLRLLATYGIRSGQVCALRFDDIDWRRETLRVPGAKGGREVLLPLQPSVSEALVDYLRAGRPAWPFREIFLRVRAPMGPLRGTLTNVIKPYARKAGVSGPLGPHAWRHACATRLLAHGHPLKVIRDLLGHRHIETTFIYTKVDIERLRQAALDWPEEAP